MKQDKQDDNEYMFENLNEYQAFVKNNKRTMLHNKSTVQWLKARYHQKTKKHYLLFPEELIEDMKIRKIFKIFDKDNSQALDLEEMVEMFQKYNIEIDKDELQQIYEIVDKTKDNALNYIEFKECAISQNANQIFSKMISKVRSIEEEKKTLEERNIYLPQRFSEMVTYLSYRINRDDLEQYLKEKSHRISERYEKYLQLMNLNGLDSAGATAHENQIKDQKKLDKASDLEQKIFDRQSSSDSDNESVEAEKSFRNQIKEEQFKKQQKAQIRLSLATNQFRKPSVLVSATASPRLIPQQLENHFHSQNNYYLQSALSGAQATPSSSNLPHSANSSSQIALSRGSLKNQRARASIKKELDDEQILTKFTKYEAQNLQKKAQIKGASDAQALFTEVSKQYGSTDNFAKTFSSQNWQSSQHQHQQSQQSANYGDLNNQSKQVTNIKTEESELKQNQSQEQNKINCKINPLLLTDNKPKGMGKLFTTSKHQNFESTQSSYNSNNNIYGKTQKFSNDDFRHTKGFSNKFGNNISTGFLTEDKKKFNNTFYTLGKRPKTNQDQLLAMGIDKSSFKNINNIMSRTLSQLENKRTGKNQFLHTAPSSSKFRNGKFQENRIQQMSQKLINQNVENNIIDPRLLQSVYKPDQVQEYQEREKLLINEIKQDIMEKFLMNNKVALSLYDNQFNLPQQNIYNRNLITQNTDQSFLKQNKQHQELEQMSRFGDKDKTPRDNFQFFNSTSSRIKNNGSLSGQFNQK